MGKSNYWSNGVLNLLFNGATLATIAENASASPLTVLYVSLHTANPGAAGNQSTSEAAYTSYARVAVNRNTGGWPTTTTEVISPAAAIVFPEATGGSETETYFGIGTAPSGSGQLLYSGPISPNIAVSTGVTPQLTTATTIQEE